MPTCNECRMLLNGECSAYERAQATLHRDIPPPPLGACMIPIVEEYLGLIKRGMTVLEIGCGSWSLIRERCNEVGAQFEGVDTERTYFGRETVATRIENLAALSFQDESIDLVIGNQTMEHWGENGCALKWGLYQCFRVCRPHGQVLMNVPIHFHGTQEFMLGDLDRLDALFAPFSSRVSFSKWGLPSDPIPIQYPFPGYWRLRDHPPYVLDIRAIKDRPLPHGYSNRGATSGRLAQLLNYPPSYNVYRVFRKAGLITDGPSR
jgi:SAM-dependent methyltransferase